MGCIAVPLVVLLLALIGAHWVLGALGYVFMHPLIVLVEVGAAVALVSFMIHLAPDAARWVGETLERRKK
jgi:hypothetical protein